MLRKSRNGIPNLQRQTCETGKTQLGKRAMNQVNIFGYTDYGDVLNAEFTSRKARNHRYSLRSFARFLGMSPSNMSEVLRKKHGLSVALAEKISLKLGYEPEQSRYFMDLVIYRHGENSDERQAAMLRLRDIKLNQEFEILPDDIFKMISNWYHLAIIELTKLTGFSMDTDWMATRLGIQPLDALQAVNRLKRAQLLEIKDKGVRLMHKSMRIFPQPQASLLFKKQVMKMAAKAVSKSAPHSHFGSTFVAVNREDIPRIVKRMQDFRYELSLELAQAEIKDEVICLGDIIFSVLDQGDASVKEEAD